MKEPYQNDSLGPEFVHTLRARFDAASGSKARRLYLGLYDLLASGHLPVGTRLPASRALAQALGVGRNTVTAAYQQLVDEDLLYTAQRGGTRVRGLNAAHQVAAHTKTEATGTVPTGSVELSARGESRALSRRASALSPGEPDANLFPRQAWSRALARAARVPGLSLGYRYDTGEPMLREAVTRYLARWRALVVDPEQVLITASTRQSLAVAAGLYAHAGDIAWVESPGYNGVGDAWQLMGLQLRALAVDEMGMRCPEQLDGARLLYTTPCFQYPLGHGLAPARRAALLHRCATSGTVIFEDDYDSEFRDGSQPRPALASDASVASATVLHAGTFSKLMFPGVRLGWLVLPPDHVRAGVGMLRSVGGGHNPVQQRAVAALLDDGTVARHLVRARATYGRRRAALIAALADGPLTVRGTSGGLSLVLDLATPVPRAALVAALREASLGAQPLEESLLTSDSNDCVALVVGTGNVDEGALPEVVERLHRVCNQLMA